MPRVTHSLVKALLNVPDFSSLDDRALLRILGASANLFWPAGSIVFEQGTRSEALYVVLAGQIRIFERVDDREVEVADYGPGFSFGELSLMLGRVHTRTAQAIQDTDLLVIPEDSFLDLLASNDDLNVLFHNRLQERTAVQGDVAAAGG